MTRRAVVFDWLCQRLADVIVAPLFWGVRTK